MGRMIEFPETVFHPVAIDLTGLEFGRLKVLGVAGRTGDKHLKWTCQCSCGKRKHIASNSLTRKNPVQSCGCMNRTAAQGRRLVNGPWNEGKSYSIEGGNRCYKTRHAWAKAAIRLYGNACEVCGWNLARCDVHHRKAKSKGGMHTIANAMVLCPNCHRIRHEASNGD